MYTLHIGNKNYSSWSLRPWVLMRALDIPFTEEIHPFDGMPCSPEYGAFSPSGRVPLLDDGGTLVWDSLAIVEYLAERHPGVWPADPVRAELGALAHRPKCTRAFRRCAMCAA